MISGLISCVGSNRVIPNTGNKVDGTDLENKTTFQSISVIFS